MNTTNLSCLAVVLTCAVPATGSFAPTGNMSPSPQHIGGVPLPDGLVLFAGINFTGTPTIVELYDPATGSFSIALQEPFGLDRGVGD